MGKVFGRIARAWRHVALAFFSSSLCWGAATAAPVPSPWTVVATVPLPGEASRFDYESLDPSTGKLYLAHLGDGRLVVVDTRNRRVVADLPGFPDAHGVLAVPGLHRVYVTVSPRSRTMRGDLAIVDANTLRTVALAPAGLHPDGLDYDPVHRWIFVSNEWGRSLSVVEGRTGRTAGTVPLPGEVGNTRYDALTKRIYATVQTRNILARVDPATLRVDRVMALPCRHPHGLWIEPRRKQAFVACEKDARLLVVDLTGRRVSGIFSVGPRPDVLSADGTRHLLFVASESGWVTVFREHGRTLEKRSENFMGVRAHSILADPATHLLYLPLENKNGHPVLEILRWQEGRARRDNASP